MTISVHIHTSCDYSRKHAFLQAYSPISSAFIRNPRNRKNWRSRAFIFDGQNPVLLTTCHVTLVRSGVCISLLPASHKRSHLPQAFPVISCSPARSSSKWYYFSILLRSFKLYLQIASAPEFSIPVLTFQFRMLLVIRQLFHFKHPIKLVYLGANTIWHSQFQPVCYELFMSFIRMSSFCCSFLQLQNRFLILQQKEFPFLHHRHKASFEPLA